MVFHPPNSRHYIWKDFTSACLDKGSTDRFLLLETFYPAGIMSSAATQGTNEAARGCRNNKNDKTRRSWSEREEKVLLAALKELVVQGWKSDNGFRAGYLTKLEEAMRKEFPTTDLKAMPHINSKTTTWKKNYYSLYEMLKLTGVGFNANGTHMVDCNNEQWEAIVKKDPNARLMRYKSWPYLDAWREIFGKDRANGDTAEDMMEAAHQMYRTIDLDQHGGEGDYHVEMDDVFEQTAEPESASEARLPEVTPRVINRKRKTREAFSGVCDTLVEISRGTKESLDAIGKRMGHDVDIAEARKQVYVQLSVIPGLTQKAIFEVCDLLAKEVERLDIFTSLPDAAKPDYVMHLLEDKYKK